MGIKTFHVLNLLEEQLMSAIQFMEDFNGLWLS